jgi:hypothetical protein
MQARCDVYRGYLVARAASLAVLEDGDVAAGRHAKVGSQVHVLDAARATCKTRYGIFQAGS